MISIAAAITAFCIVAILITWFTPMSTDVADRPSVPNVVHTSQGAVVPRRGGSLDDVLFEETDTQEALAGSVFASSGDYFLMSKDTPVRFRSALRVVEAVIGDAAGTSQLRAPVRETGQTSVALPVPSGWYGYVVHAPEEAAALRAFQESDNSARHPAPPTSEFIRIETLDDLPVTSTWIVLGDYVVFTSEHRLLFGNEIEKVGPTVVNDGQGGPMTVSAMGMEFDVPPGEAGYIVRIGSGGSEAPSGDASDR